MLPTTPDTASAPASGNDPVSQERGSRAHRVLTLGSITALAIVLAPIAYWTAFSVFRDWDDEGYFLLTFRGFTSGEALYDQVYTQYGPVLYELVGGLGHLFGADFTTDQARFFTLAGWVVSSALLGLAAARFTGSILIGLAAQLVSFSSFDFLVNIPMHPTALILCLLGAAGLAFASIDHGRVESAGVTIGIVAAAIALIKINVGALLVVAVLAVLLASIPRDRGNRRVAALGATIALAAVPILLMRSAFSVETSVAFLIALVAAIVAVGAQSVADGPPATRALSVRLLGIAIAAGSITAAVGLLGALVTGTSAHGLLDGILLEPLAMSDAYTVQIDVPFGSATTAVAVSAFGALAPMIRRGRRDGLAAAWGVAVVSLAAIALLIVLHRHDTLYLGAKIEVKGALLSARGAGILPIGLLCAAAAVAIARRLWAPLRRRQDLWVIGESLARLGAGLAGLLALAGLTDVDRLLVPTSLAWVALFPPTSMSLSERQRLGRTLLVTAAVMQTAMVHPVGGGQAQLAVALLVVALAVPMGDGITVLRPLLARGRAGVAGASALTALALTLALGLPIVADRWQAAHARMLAGAPVDASGASRLRIEPTLARDLSALVEDVRARCDAVMGYPGFGSLVLWTGVRPVTSLNPGDWMSLLDASQQEKIVRALRSRPRRCVVYNETVYRHWLRNRPTPTGPLIEEVDRYRPVARYGRYVVEVDPQEAGRS